MISLIEDFSMVQQKVANRNNRDQYGIAGTEIAVAVQFEENNFLEIEVFLQ